MHPVGFSCEPLADGNQLANLQKLMSRGRLRPREVGDMST